MKKLSFIVTFGLLVMGRVAFSQCTLTPKPPNEWGYVYPTCTPTPTRTPIGPTATPTSTIAVPTNTPIPTVTPLVTATPTPTPKYTRTPLPTPTPGSPPVGGTFTVTVYNYPPNTVYFNNGVMYFTSNNQPVKVEVKLVETNGVEHCFTVRLVQ